jgi:hypothetical protein
MMMLANLSLLPRSSNMISNPVENKAEASKQTAPKFSL